MTVIDSYLDTLFAPYPTTPRLREARRELRAMMEDKQQDLMADGLSESQAVGQVIAEFGTLEEAAPVLGIDAELSQAAAAPTAPVLDIDRARRYVEAMQRTRWMPAAGLALFVLCAAPLLLLLAMSSGLSGEPATWAVAVGITAVLVLVALGLLLMTLQDLQLKDFEDIGEGEFTPGPQVRPFAEDLRRRRRRPVALAGGAAIGLWILCALPVILSGLLAPQGSPAPLYGVSGTLAMVAAGLALWTSAGWSDTAVSALLQEEGEKDDSPERSDSAAVRVIAAIYWPLATAVYLAWSFASNDWGITWLVWPVAGVLYAGLSGLGVALRRDEGAAEARAR